MGSSSVAVTKTQLSRILQSGEFLGIIFGPLLKTDEPLMKNIPKPLVECTLLPLRLTAAATQQQQTQQQTQEYIKNLWIGDDNINNFKQRYG